MKKISNCCNLMRNMQTIQRTKQQKMIPESDDSVRTLTRTVFYFLFVKLKNTNNNFVSIYSPRILLKNSNKLTKLIKVKKKTVRFYVNLMLRMHANKHFTNIVSYTIKTQKPGPRIKLCSKINLQLVL